MEKRHQANSRMRTDAKVGESDLAVALPGGNAALVRESREENSRLQSNLSSQTEQPRRSSPARPEEKAESRGVKRTDETFCRLCGPESRVDRLV